MRIRWIRWTLIVSSFSLLTSTLFAADPSSVFVQSQTTQLKKAPDGKAESAGDLKRGDELKIIKKEGIWLQVKTASNTEGWIPKILTSNVKPLGQAQLLNDTSKLDSNAKTSRRRTTDYAVSAATRGLAASERHRPGDENFRSNRKAVEDLEKLKVTSEQLKNFKNAAQIRGQ